MSEKPIGSSFVVIWTYYQQRIRTFFFRTAAKLYGMRGIIGTRSCNDQTIVAGIGFASVE